MHCPESDSLLFIGSPFIDGLEGLTGSGLFISDIPLHDATRDVILVGEQARAQVNNVRLLRFPFLLLLTETFRLEYVTVSEDFPIFLLFIEQNIFRIL